MILKHSDLLVSNEQKKEQKERRAARVSRKLFKEKVRDQETEDELRRAISYRDSRSEGATGAASTPVDGN